MAPVWISSETGEFCRFDKDFGSPNRGSAIAGREHCPSPTGPKKAPGPHAFAACRVRSPGHREPVPCLVDGALFREEGELPASGIWLRVVAETW